MAKGTSNMRAKGNPLGSNRAESDIDMLGKAFIETSDYHTMANGPAYNAVVGRRGAGKSALFWRLTEHFKERSDIKLLAIKPRASTFTGLAGTVHRVLGEQAGYAQARETMRHGWRATFYAHLLSKFQKTGLPVWLKDNPLETALALIASFQGAEYQDVVYNVGRAAEQLEPQVQQALRDRENRGVVLIDGIDEGWIGAAVENGILGGLAAAAADLQDHEAGVRLVIFIRDNMYRILGEHDPDFSRILAGDSLRLDWNHDSLLELVAARIRLALGLAADMSAVDAWNRFAKTDLKGKSGFHAILKHTLYRPRDVLELLNRAIQIAQRQGREALTSADVDVAAREISVSRYQDLQKEYASVLPGIADLLGAFSGRPAICTIRELASWLSTLDLADDAAATAARLGGPARVMQALFGVGFIGVEESAGAFRFCHDGSDAHLDRVSDSGFALLRGVRGQLTLTTFLEFLPAATGAGLVATDLRGRHHG